MTILSLSLDNQSCNEISSLSIGSIPIDLPDIIV